MKYKIRDVIVFKASKEAIIITDVNEEDQQYTFSYIHLDHLDTGYVGVECGLTDHGGTYVGNDIDFETIRMLYL